MNFNFSGNWVDLILILACIYFVSQALHFGFWVMLADFLSFFFSIILSLALYPQLASLLHESFALSTPLSYLVSFLILAIIFESVISHITTYLLGKLILKLKGFKIKNIFAVIPGLLEATLVTSFLLNIALILPISPVIKVAISDSFFGSRIVEKTVYFEAKLKEIFGGVATESLSYLTVDNGEEEKKIVLPVTKNKLSVDEESEKQMLSLVNSERERIGIRRLSENTSLTSVARAYATEMWEKHYFSHTSLDGYTVADRLKRIGFRFSVVGENLALAPTVVTAHTGLINSEGHKRNILDTSFSKVGIGVIDNGIYGKMFVQVFTD